MLETENRIKSDKKTIAKLKEEQLSLTKMLDKHEKLLEDSNEAQAKSADLKNLRSQLQEIEFKLKKVKNKAKEDEKKFAEVHESVVSTEERCRNMNEIVKFK